VLPLIGKNQLIKRFQLLPSLFAQTENDERFTIEEPNYFARYLFLLMVKTILVIVGFFRTNFALCADSFSRQTTFSFVAPQS